MRPLFSIFLLLSLAFCKPKGGDNLSNDVFIVLYPNDFSVEKKTLNENVHQIKFSNEFWHYFISSHPRVSMTIFAHHLYAEHYPFLIINDTTFEYYPVGFYPEDLDKMLSDTAGGIEKLNLNVGTVWKKDYKYLPTSRHVNDSIAREFNSFKKILSYRDKQNYYVLLYRKNLLQSILH